MITILVDEITPRIKYTAEFVFKERGIRYRLETDTNHFDEKEDLKINYSSTIISIPTIPFSSLMKLKYIDSFRITKNRFHNIECLSFDDVSDPIASIFYVLTRMEEYNNPNKDHLERFPGKKSISYKFGWHEHVICDRWAESIISFIEKEYKIKLERSSIHSNAIPSFDIDNTYAYKNKGLLRTSMSYLKDIFLGRKNRIIERQKVTSGKIRDPYDTFDKIFSLHELGLQTRIFWLLGDFSKYDKNLHFKNSKQSRLIKKMSEKCQIGIHPSVKSTEYEYYLHNEIERLSEILGDQKITKARQHFLKIKIPETYKTFIQQEIEEDFTMGYADIVGFRCGTARPHYWYDLKENAVSRLKIFPFAFMDGTLLEYLKLSPKEAIEKIDHLSKEIINYGGEFSFIWHNETIGDYGIWKGWSKVFKFSIEKCIEINEK